MTSIETPFFFGSAEQRLFGVIHEPVGPTFKTPYVFCHPFGEEKLWAHRVFVAYSRRLAAEGYLVLRFDYRGNGDSEGDFSDTSLAMALSDVRDAIAYVRARTGEPAVNLLGLRLGATIASLVAETDGSVDELILWEPVVDGARYMQELLRTNLTVQMAMYKEVRQDRGALVEAMRRGETVNVDGYELSLPMFEEISAVRLADGRKRHEGQCLVVRIDRQGRPAAELERLVTRYGRGTLVVAEEEPFWKEILRFYGDAPNLFGVTSAWRNDRIERRDSPLPA
jgi:exosortase A-associated hydrolase 2